VEGRYGGGWHVGRDRTLETEYNVYEPQGTSSGRGTKGVWGRKPGGGRLLIKGMGMGGWAVWNSKSMMVEKLVAFSGIL